ncbi:hypothetical protein NDA11_004440 [Ustilago hordei]|uniref:Uncharacterized protein n=1 Tax=Ustilago hordei TaxID=120017 RepID=I2G0J6_USTHO|nr:hypothetical protein NDA11_004440 [Ustilago hordei]KAJ1594891.1 hypothetical protein NDA14_001053 [Ustilago hordei]UTT91871.1 hypothetical protein NDA17_001369 [Ustilago hordei]CCF52689.1 uncharacterized protein UHOR_15602 [Ustilago hordei]
MILHIWTGSVIEAVLLQISGFRCTTSDTRVKPSGSSHQNSSERSYSIDLTEINQDRQIQVSGMRPLTPCSPPHTVLDFPAINSACPHSGLSLYWESEQLHQLLPLGRMGKGVQQQCLDNHIGLQMYG